MGIPGFYQWLRSSRNIINQDISNRLVSTISLDFNAILHTLAAKVFGTSLAANIYQQYELDWQLFTQTIEQYLQNLLQLMKPQDYLYIAVDGVAVQGKMTQQRKRRLEGKNTTLPTLYESNMITPGTDFMLRLDYVMKDMVNKLLTYEHAPYFIIYSSHLVPGEGEHKIMDFYRNDLQQVNNQGPAQKANGVHVLISPDLDIIMLTAIAPLKNIIVGREMLERGSSRTIYDLIDIDKLRLLLQDKLYNTATQVNDFVLITMLIGNDFMGHHPAFVDVKETTNILIDVYNQCKKSLTIDKEINWLALLDYFRLLKEKEPTLLAKAATTKFVYPPLLLQSAIIAGKFYLQNFSTAWYKRALLPRNPAFQQDINRWLNQANKEEVTHEQLYTMVRCYLNTLAWNYRYYQQGWSTVNFYWYYAYDYVPLFTEIVIYVEYMLTSNFVLSDYLPTANNGPVSVLHQLCAVMPLRSKSLLPIMIQPLMDYNSVIADYYPFTYITEKEGINKDHMALIIIPPVQLQRVIDAVASITLTLEQYNTYAIQSPLTFSNDMQRYNKILNYIANFGIAANNTTVVIKQGKLVELKTPAVPEKVVRKADNKTTSSQEVFKPKLVAPLVDVIPYFPQADPNYEPLSDDLIVNTSISRSKKYVKQSKVPYKSNYDRKPKPFSNSTTTSSVTNKMAALLSDLDNF